MRFGKGDLSGRFRAFPRFKSRKHSTPSFYQDNVKIQFTKTHVKVEGFAVSKKKNKQQVKKIKKTKTQITARKREFIAIITAITVIIESIKIISLIKHYIEFAILQFRKTKVKN